MNNVEQPSVTFRPAAFLSGSPGLWAAHLPFAYDLIAAIKPQLIVELGVYYGDSYFGFCQAVVEHNLSCTCYGVDTWKDDKETGSYGNSVYDAVRRHNEQKYRSFSYLIRKTFDDALSQFSSQTISLLHINGLRTYEAVQHDFETWLPKVRPGGVVLLPDIAVRSADYGVWRLWEGLQRKFPNFAFRNSNGLGVLWKPGGPDEKNPYLRELFSSSKENQERIRRYYFLCAERLELSHRLGTSRAADAGHSLLQLFHATGEQQYHTGDDLSQVIEAGKWNDVSFRMPDGLGDRPLRIDVANRTAVIEIANIVVKRPDGQVVWNWSPTTASDNLRVEGTAMRMPSDDSLRILSFGTDPKVFLPELREVAVDEPLEIEIRLRADLELGPVRDMTNSWLRFERERLEFEEVKKQELLELNELKARQMAELADKEAALEREAEQLKKELEDQLAQAKRSFDGELVKIRDNSEKKISLLRDEFDQKLLDLDTAHQTKLAQVNEEAENRLAAVNDELQAFHAESLQQLAEERKSSQAVLAEKEQLQRSHIRVAQEASIARGNVEDLKAEIERLTTIQVQMEDDLADLRKLNARMAATLDQERLTRSMMEQSSSWQLTKPIRAVTDLLGTRKR